MIKKSYQTETVESVNKDYVLVFVKNVSSILRVQEIINTLRYVKKEKTGLINAIKPSSSEKENAIRIYPTNDITTQDLKYFIEEVLSDGDVLAIRDYLKLMNRRDILDDYDRVVLKMVKNEWEHKLVEEMQNLLKVILSDLTVNCIFSSIKRIEEKSSPENSDTFITHEKTMALFNAINKYIVDCKNNTIVA